MFRACFRPFSNTFRPLRPIHHHHLFTPRLSPSKKDVFPTRRTAARVSVVTVLTASSIFLALTVYGDSASDEQRQAASMHTRPTFGSLIRSYVVYSMCSVPGLVDASPKILSILSSVPGVRQVTEAFVRVTFFDQVRRLRDCMHDLCLTHPPSL
jgi:proline dehydrogenase